MVAVAAGLLLTIVPATAQAPSTPRMADGKPNLNGIWQAMNEANWNIEPHTARGRSSHQLRGALCRSSEPGSCGRQRDPYQPAAAAKRKENFAKRLTMDPEISVICRACPRDVMPYPFQIIQSQKHVMMVFDTQAPFARSHMDGKQEAPADSWMGWSNGRWEGNSLVVDSTDSSTRPGSTGPGTLQ
jgi:hypothetical protein